ncbi:hypothetical protein [Tsuneonella amylolytica]|nr:hypothetical protein [Tsuneonella amylolytica]
MRSELEDGKSPGVSVRYFLPHPSLRPAGSAMQVLQRPAGIAKPSPRH